MRMQDLKKGPHALPGPTSKKSLFLVTGPSDGTEQFMYAARAHLPKNQFLVSEAIDRAMVLTITIRIF